jgi:inhibitor of cysteine peptidase
MKRILFATLVFALLLSACASADKPSDPQVNIQASAGKEFKVLLESNPTTGYHWAIVGDLDKSVVEFVSQEYKSTSDPNLVGGGGVDTFIFKAVGAGETIITLGYYPPSNTPVDPEKTETFTVTVK